LALDYTVDTNKSFDEVVALFEKKIPGNNFRVLHIHDVKATFKEKGFEREDLKIIEVCNVKYAKEALEKDINIGLMMPCKINVYKAGGKVRISLLRPSLLASFFPGAGIEKLGVEVEKILKKVIDEVK
ncbi:MAG: DUF302 domain-containing protein, partial [Firmicutes bacterium]|nr:DUF302 domain-containing protein [Bacillota bacterium]